MSAREKLLTEAAKRILITDGAFGTEIQNWKLAEADYAGALGLPKDQKGNNDILAITAPHVPEAITRAYLDAGSDIVSTNTFSANAISQADYGAEHLVREINIASARIARACADEYAAKDGRPRFVAGAIGPTNKTLSLSPDVNDPGFREIDFDTLKASYREQCDALIEGGVDFLLVETCFDTLNAKAAGLAAREAALAAGREVPTMFSFTITDMSGRNLSGHTVNAFWNTLRHFKPIAAGINCAFGADQLRPFLANLSKQCDTLIIAYPNAGLPNDLGEYDEQPPETAAHIAPWFESGLVNIVGGCCGTTPEHIAAIAAKAKGAAPRAMPDVPVRTRLAGLEPFAMTA